MLKGINFLKARLPRRPELLRQEELLIRALSERKIELNRNSISTDHLNGINKIGTIQTGVIYPDSFFRKAKKLHSLAKDYVFYFNGFIEPAGGRKELLEGFTIRPDSKIVESSTGRKRFMKSRFNSVYFRGLASSRFALCPIHTNWPGDPQTAWTYRFIDAVIAGTLPVVFEETPLGDTFVDGFYLLSVEEAKTLKISEQDYQRMIKHNFDLAQQRFRLPENLR